MNPQGKNQQEDTRQHQKIRQRGDEAADLSGHQGIAAEIQDEYNGGQNQRNQQENAALSMAGCDICVHECKEEQRDPEQPDTYPAFDVIANPDGGIEGCHPNRDGCFVEHLLAI